MSNLYSVLDYSKLIIDMFKDSDKIAVDMTLGKGNDCKYLAKRFKKVYAFDIQEEAFLISKEKLSTFNNIEYIKDSHENIDIHINEKIKLVIYNLGYLPGLDKDITTKASSTITSLAKVLRLLEKKGVVIITVYIGHNQGLEESKKLSEYIDSLEVNDYQISEYKILNKNNAPYVISIMKR